VLEAVAALPQGVVVGTGKGKRAAESSAGGTDPKEARLAGGKPTWKRIELRDFSYLPPDAGGNHRLFYQYHIIIAVHRLTNFHSCTVAQRSRLIQLSRQRLQRPR
jgi:hypothetical protein